MRTNCSIDPPADEPAFVPAILESMFGDAPGVIAAVLETFCTSMGQQLPLMQAALAAGDTVSQQQIAHRIKGAARMSGALAMAQAAEHLEFVARGAQAATYGPSTCGAACEAVLRQWAQLPSDAAFRRARQRR